MSPDLALILPPRTLHCLDLSVCLSGSETPSLLSLARLSGPFPVSPYVSDVCFSPPELETQCIRPCEHLSGQRCCLSLANSHPGLF